MVTNPEGIYTNFERSQTGWVDNVYLIEIPLLYTFQHFVQFDSSRKPKFGIFRKYFKSHGYKYNEKLYKELKRDNNKCVLKLPTIERKLFWQQWRTSFWGTTNILFTEKILHEGRYNMYNTLSNISDLTKNE